MQVLEPKERLRQLRAQEAGTRSSITMLNRQAGRREAALQRKLALIVEQKAQAKKQL